jgi:homoserine dehydrogenase
LGKITVGILGLGTVGTGVVKLLRNDPRFRIKWLSVRDASKPREIDLGPYRVTQNPLDIVNDPEVEILIEVAGGVGSALETVKVALDHGKHVVTANKEMIAKHGAELFEIAQRRNVTILFEAAVAGGIPLISTLHRGLEANEITQVAGILNGTTNFILTSMESHDLDFNTALKQAQSLGFAEANPRDDIEGYDVSYKISILASLAFGYFVDVSSVYRQGITQITEKDIKVANELGYRIKMIGIARRIGADLEVKAHPMLIPIHHLLASVKGASNAIFISGSAVGEVTLVGPGAGQMPTASAVVGDVINIASALMLPDFASYFHPAIDSRSARLADSEDSENPFYIRLETADVPGVIGSLGLTFGKHEVSLHSVIQRGATADGGATIILLTHKAKEGSIYSALKEIENQPTTSRIGIAIRVFEPI